MTVTLLFVLKLVTYIGFVVAAIIAKILYTPSSSDDPRAVLDYKKPFTYAVSAVVYLLIASIIQIIVNLASNGSVSTLRIIFSILIFLLDLAGYYLLFGAVRRWIKAKQSKDK